VAEPLAIPETSFRASRLPGEASPTTAHRLARRIALISALTAAGTAAAQTSASYTPTDGYERVSGVDVLHYDIRVVLPDSGASIDGRTGILFEVLRDGLRELPLDFGALVVDSASVNEAAAPFRHDGMRLSVSLPALARGARAEAVVWYHGTPQDGLFLQRNKHGAPAVFADNWPDRARHWFPGIDHPSDKATVDFVVDAPAGLEVVANGAPRGVEDLGGGRRRTSWSESEDLPTYNMVIGAADFAIQRVPPVNAVEISNWLFPQDSAAGAVAFSRSPEIVALFDSLFGPYPFEKLANVQSSTRFGGMENSSAIFFDEKAIGSKVAPATGSATAAPSRPAASSPSETAPDTSIGGASLSGEETAGEDGTLTDLAAHETAHQWFGDAVTEADWHHLWLSEGFATYLEAVFFELRGGPRGRGPGELKRRMRESAEKIF
jgi:aminopeptidase N